jgi:hypothetical protein
MLVDIAFELVPIPLIVAYFLARGADWAWQRLDLTRPTEFGCSGASILIYKLAWL